MKRILAIVLVCCFALCSFGLSACECTHQNTTEQTILEATCSQQGVKIVSCTHCGKKLEQEVIPKLSHQESEWIVDRQASCNDLGLKHIECTICHTVLNSASVGENIEHSYIYGECEVCGDVDESYMTKGLTFALINNDSEYEIVAYTGQSVQVIIPAIYKGKAVTSIKANAFSDCDALISVIIPDSVQTIGANAFSGCDKLTICCEHQSQPSGWDSLWNSSNCTVLWAGEQEEGDGSSNDTPSNDGSNTVNPPSGWFD